MQLKATRRFLLSCRIKRAYAFYCGIRNFFVFIHALLLLKDLSVYFKMNYIVHKRVLGCVYLRLSTYFSLGKKDIVDMIRNSFKLADAENCDIENMLYRQPNTYV